ncbi:hypothetical protein PQX77_006127 [Marasmius sp. AFHP31]|nr:hypothetical protein PQX77_006127 [Marasmius sp. AFHP31]
MPSGTRPLPESGSSSSKPEEGSPYFDYGQFNSDQENNLRSSTQSVDTPGTFRGIFLPSIIPTAPVSMQAGSSSSTESALPISLTALSHSSTKTPVFGPSLPHVGAGSVLFSPEVGLLQEDSLKEAPQVLPEATQSDETAAWMDRAVAPYEGPLYDFITLYIIDALHPHEPVLATYHDLPVLSHDLHPGAPPECPKVHFTVGCVRHLPCSALVRVLCEAMRNTDSNGVVQQGHVEKELFGAGKFFITFATTFQIPDQNLSLAEGGGYRLIRNGGELSLDGNVSEVCEFIPALNLQDAITERFIQEHGTGASIAKRSSRFLLIIGRTPTATLSLPAVSGNASVLQALGETPLSPSSPIVRIHTRSGVPASPNGHAPIDKIHNEPGSFGNPPGPVLSTLPSTPTYPISIVPASPSDSSSFTFEP